MLTTLNSPCEAVIVSGEGSFLANQILDNHSKLKSATRHSLASMFSPDAANAACAFALTRLAGERPATFTDSDLSNLLSPDH